MSSLLTRLVIAALCGQIAAPQTSPSAVSSAQTIVSERCIVSLIEDIPLAAPEAGLVTAVGAREGAHVDAGAIIVQVDDRQAQTALRVAEAELNVVKQRTLNDVDVRHAQAARNVADSELRLNQEANRRQPGTKSALEMRRLELTLIQTELEIERAQHEQKITGHQADALQARLDQARTDIERRRVAAPVAGEVIELQVQPGQWVQAGQTVARLVRLDRLRIEGFLDPALVAPGQISGRPVRVQVSLERGRTAAFTGQIVFVHPLVESHGQYRVWAEVVNQQEQGRWLLHPGQKAEMAIEMSNLASRPPQ